MCVTQSDASTQTEKEAEMSPSGDDSELESEADDEDELDDEEGDPTYFPDDDDLEETAEFHTELSPPHLETKFLVSQSCLLDLFTNCKEKHCPYTPTYKMRTVGTMVAVTSTCEDGHSNTWYSQPVHKGMPWGNLSLAAASLFSGSSYQKVSNFLKHLKVPCISESTYYQMQRAYLVPVVVDYWSNLQEVHLTMLKGQSITVAGDGRCDSPGHCAKYCSYSLMDTASNKILDTQLIQVILNFIGTIFLQ